MRDVRVSELFSDISSSIPTLRTERAAPNATAGNRRQLLKFTKMEKSQSDQFGINKLQRKQRIKALHRKDFV
ncbi:unnamed protein product [Brugia pahangi]|uniref:Uncharacterized protein n=1 Tax=Brugia pahangi TaxID=6280 RepID=A0A0N4TCI1_BRUPA|nr:unnamed protein product [Brugia pahangi]